MMKLSARNFCSTMEQRSRHPTLYPVAHVRSKGRKPLRSGTRTRKLVKETSFVPDPNTFRILCPRYGRNEVSTKPTTPEEFAARKREAEREGVCVQQSPVNVNRIIFLRQTFFTEFTVDKCRRLGLSNRRSSWWNHGRWETENHRCARCW